MNAGASARPSPPVFREAVIDLDAIAGNVARLRAHIGTEHTMAVVKADGYGHGLVPSARAAMAGGADWLGVADIDEALALRAAGISAPVLAWLHAPHTDFRDAVAAGIDIGISTLEQLDAAAEAVHVGGGSAGGSADMRVDGSTVAAPAYVQLKLDTGLSRNGIAPAAWETVVARAVELERAGTIRVRGLFGHVSNTSPADDRAALGAFDRGVDVARAAGLTPEVLHMAATASACSLPESRYSMVRLGIGIYGLSPLDPGAAADAFAALGLTPAMRLHAPVVAVRDVPPHTGVSYGYTYRTERATTLALVPVGYADGVPRQASNGGAVLIGGRIRPVAGRVAMDQFVVDVGDAAVRIGDEAVLFGDPASGAPSADDWARAAGTINYEIVTRIGPRVVRRYVGG